MQTDLLLAAVPGWCHFSAGLSRWWCQYSKTMPQVQVCCNIGHGSAPLYEATSAKFCGVPDSIWLRNHIAVFEDCDSQNRAPSLCRPPLLPGVSFFCDGRPAAPNTLVGPLAVHSSALQPVELRHSEHGTVTCTGGGHFWQGAQCPEYQPLFHTEPRT